jgi:hypothetical protein
MCHAREREHPEYHDATGLALRRFRRLPGLRRRFVVSHGWIPAFAGMTHGRRGIVASIEKAEQHLADGLDVVTDALAHRNAVARDEAFQHEVVLCIRGVVIA